MSKQDAIALLRGERILELGPMTRRPGLAFHLPCVPPTTTHQAKRIARRGKFVRLIDKPELQQARHDLEALLMAHRPAQPFTGPVRLELQFTWPWLKGHSAKVRAQGRVLKVTKPDCSNLAKTLEDRLAFLRFLEDDAQVAILGPISKWHGDQPGISVRLEPCEEPR
jgi:Holliday junction resolvase RusA-like endonuclease